MRRPVLLATVAIFALSTAAPAKAPQYETAAPIAYLVDLSSGAELLVKNAEGEDVVTRVGYNRVEATKRRPDGSEYKGYRSIRIARATGEEI